MKASFKALLVSGQDGKFTKDIRDMNTDQLPAGELLIRVNYSSVNFKDALSASGVMRVTKQYPHVPGIDAAGTVVSSESDLFKPGDPVIVTGFDLGMNTWGGFGEYIRIPAAWALPLPAGMSLQEAMSFGTAGLTAGLSILRVINAGIKPESGEIVISGASGGVGSIATAILSKNGFKVAVISGKPDESFLKGILGANRILGREEFIDTYNAKPLSSAAFAAGVDTVGGTILSGMLKATQYGGIVTACGNVSSTEINTSIFPFILRDITLAGIDSVVAPIPVRKQVWELLASTWKPDRLSDMVTTISLDALPEALDTIYAGKAKGRYLLQHRP